MPKRSNAFQKLVLLVYQQMVEAGGTVTESVLLKERGNGTIREVDILIEKTVAGILIRIAIECRGRSRKDDIDWIDGLVGKYVNLEVDKVVAISQSGFSSGALEKAKAHQIDALTLKAALQTDWPKECMRIGIASVERFDDREIGFHTEPKLEAPANLGDIIVDSNGDEIGTVQELNDMLVEKFNKQMADDLKSNMLKYFPTVGDFEKSHLTAMLPWTPPVEMFLRKESGRFRINVAVLRVQSRFTSKKIPIQRFSLGEAVITKGTIVSGSDTPVEITVAQSPNNAHQAKINIRPVKTELKKKSKSRGTKKVKRKVGQLAGARAVGIAGTGTYCWSAPEVHAMIEFCESNPKLRWLAQESQ